ncbi:ATP-binding protein [Candidatus Omnitrophota bacterium]
MDPLGTLFKGRQLYIVFSSIVLVVLVGIADNLTGAEISFSIFYLLPVSLVSWYLGIWYGISFSVICSFLWLMNEIMGGHTYSNQIFIYWNTVVRGIIFLMAAILLSKLKHYLTIERNLRDSATFASSQKSEFLANMSHEIRTPMNAVIGTANLLSESELSGEQHEYVQILKKEGDRLLRIINDVLDLSKIETGQYTLENIAFNLDQLIKEIASLMGARVHEKNLEFSYNLMQGVPTSIIGDPDALQRVIINLIGNAVKFTEKGVISLLIENEPDGSGAGHLRFSVSDTGVGIPDEKLGLIFERFTQADSSVTRKYGGTGLGLSISKKMVELMGGKIWVESTVGHGSSFIFCIPFDVSDIKDNSISSDELHKKDTIDVTDKRALNILLVEDYEASRRIIQAFLKTTPYVLDMAENGKIAVEKVKTKTYDVVLMDMQMPVMDGLEATKTIRAWEQDKEAVATPIIALTAHAYKEDVKKSIDSGCNDHLSKPISKKNLLEAIYSNTVSAQPEESQEFTQPSKSRIIIPADMQFLIPDFLHEMEVFYHTMRKAVYKNDFGTIREISHKMKGAGGSYGFDDISNFGDSLEKAAMKNERIHIIKQLDHLSLYLENVEVRYE